jgi:DNA-binding response OmpR family regulator
MRLLLAEDETELSKALCAILKHNNYSVDAVYNGREALGAALTGNYVGIILDIMMPGLDGFELIKIIRKKSTVPVVFLTGKVREEDVLYGYELGADDYIVKPFSIAILYSKLLALLERTSSDVVRNKVLESGKISLDPLRFEVKVSGEVVDLPPKEYQILKYMMEHPGTAITRKLLLAVAWGDDMYITERVIDNRVKNLRNKLHKEGNHIKTLIGVGYRFD